MTPNATTLSPEWAENSFVGEFGGYERINGDISDIVVMNSAGAECTWTAFTINNQTGETLYQQFAYTRDKAIALLD